MEKTTGAYRSTATPRGGVRWTATVAILVVVALAGCGGGSKTATTTAGELALQRGEWIEVIDGLRSAAPTVHEEVGRARAVWPKLAKGLPGAPTMALRRLVARAASLAGGLPEPRFMAQASRLTGPAAGVAGLYETYARLSERGWRLTEASIATILSGQAAPARFARANSSLYLDSIYDSHYDLSLLGKAILDGYERLGGEGTFREKLPLRAVRALAAAYSIAATRLSPHPRLAGE